MTTIDKIREIAEAHQARKIDGTLIDAMTATLIVRIAERLSDRNRARFEALTADRMATAAWKMVR